MRGSTAKRIRKFAYGKGAHKDFVAERRGNHYGVIFHQGEVSQLGPFIVHVDTNLPHYKAVKKSYKLARSAGDREFCRKILA